MYKGTKNRSDAPSRHTGYKEKRTYHANTADASQSRGGYGRKERAEDYDDSRKSSEGRYARGGYGSSGSRSYKTGESNSRNAGHRGGFGSSEGRASRGGYGSSGSRSYKTGENNSRNAGYRGGFGSSEGRASGGGYGSSESRSYKSRKFDGGRDYSEKKRYGRDAKNSQNREKSPENFLNAEEGTVRLNKFIANSGVCSRREADTYIETGLVTVNGKVVTELGTKVMATDDIRFNGERLKGEMKVYVLLNKPKGYVTTLNDPHAEKTVMDLISREKCPQRVFPIGRLDKATTGVLMLTNDGVMAERLMHPSFETKKIYHVTLDKNLKGSDFNAIIEGIHLEDGEIHADSLSYVDDDKSQVGIEIHSGRNRIVRRIFEHLGYKVKKLDRVYFAGFTKKNLKRGQWRFLTQDELNMLMMAGVAR